jgi:hypothetical protein
VKVKETSLLSEKKKKDTWEQEVVWYLIEDVNKATNLLESMNKDK